MVCDMEQYLTWFKDFTQGFHSTDTDRVNIGIKRDHSLRVMENSLRIAHSLELDDTLIRLIQIAALLHDVGRFPQYARFRTFNDSLSVNHALLGVKVLREVEVLAGLAPEHRCLILGAIFLHNRRTLAPDLSSRLNLVSRVIRDADKLDIFSVVLSHLEPGAPRNRVVTLNLKPHPQAYSKAILSGARSGKQVRYEEMAWTNDLKLLLCSWMYDFNYPVSLAIVEERQYLKKLFGLLPEDPELTAFQEELTQVVAEGGIGKRGRDDGK